MLVNVQHLIGRPGQSDTWDETVDPQDLVPSDTEDLRWDPPGAAIDGMVVADLKLESVVDGILARGTLDVDLVMACARCLTELTAEHTLPIAELFHDPRKMEVEDYTEGEDYLIESDIIHIDLVPAIRDAVTLAVPNRPLCTADCQGLCPTCGVDRNEQDCGHGQQQHIDPRWAALADLDLDTDEADDSPD